MKRAISSVAAVLLFAVTACASSSVIITWNPSPSADVVGYNVYWGVASRTYTNKLTVANTNTATVTGLIEGTTYFFLWLWLRTSQRC